MARDASPIADAFFGTRIPHAGTALAPSAGMAKRVAILLAICLTTPLLGQNRKEENIVLDAAEKHVVRENYHNDEAVTLSGDR
jgi:hypothetical protein